MKEKHIVPSNYTQIPNVLIDYWMKELNPTAFKIVMAIARKTFGWQKNTDAISLTQLQDITGAGRQGVVNAIKELESLGLISGKRSGRKSTQWTIKVVEVVHSVDQQTSQVVHSVDQQVVHSVDTQKKVLKKESKITNESPSAPAGSAQTLVAEFIILHQDNTGETPAKIPQASGIFKQLLKYHPYETISGKLKAYYTQKHWFTKDQSYSITSFSHHYDEIKSLSPGGNTEEQPVGEAVPWDEMMADPGRKK